MSAHGGMQAAGHIPQFVQRLGDLTACSLQPGLGNRVSIRLLSEQAESLEPGLPGAAAHRHGGCAPGGGVRSGALRPPARYGNRAVPAAEPGVLLPAGHSLRRWRPPRRRPPAARFLAERGVVHQCCHRLAVLLDQCRPSAAIRLRKASSDCPPDRPNCRIGAASRSRTRWDPAAPGPAAPGGPVLGWLAAGPRFSPTPALARRIEKPRKEGEWRQPGHCEGCQPDVLEAWQLERAGKKQCGQHDECQAEAIDQHLGR